MNSVNNEIVKAVLDTVERFASREIADEVFEIDKYPYSDYAAKALKGAVEAGLLLTTVPEEYGGTGMPPNMWARILEKVAYVDAGFAAGLMAHAMALQAILDHADKRVVEDILEKAPLAYPIYHRVGDMENMPELSPDGTTVSGRAKMIANAPVAQKAVIVALREDEPCLCLVHLTDEARPEPIETLGLRACPVGDIVMDKIDAADISVLVRGKKAIDALHGSFYSSATAIILSTLKASTDYAIEYGRERYQGGQAISNHTQLRIMYSTMQVEHKSLSLAWDKSLDPEVDPEACMALKILTGEHAIRGTTDGVQLLGGYGYTMEYPQEKRMRDARQASELLGSPPRQKMALINGMLDGGD